jgi:pimeloyl-ACP methyl ester carboxylesterase
MTEADILPMFLTRPDGLRLAYHWRAAAPGNRQSTLVFLPGYMSDMTGGKAVALAAYAERTGRAILRFDYAGCGASEGVFEEQTLTGWRDDVVLMIDRLTQGPVTLVGSSMGGWLMLLAALSRPMRVKALVGIAAAPDFTDWGFSQDEKMTILRQGRLERPSDYGDAPMVTSRAFWQSGEANRMLAREIAFDGPVRLLHGWRDKDVPWEYSPEIARRLRSIDVQLHLVKDGDHRLSRDSDIALLVDIVARIP